MLKNDSTSFNKSNSNFSEKTIKVNLESYGLNFFSKKFLKVKKSQKHRLETHGLDYFQCVLSLRLCAAKI